MEEDKKPDGFTLMLFEVALVVGVVLIVSMLMRPDQHRQDNTPTPIATETPTNTSTPIATVTPTSTPTPTMTPTMTPSPSPTPTPIPSETKKVGAGGHTFKPYTRYTAYDMKSSQQYKLQQIALTSADTGIRMVQDPLGDWRYCVALGTYWCGGHPEHIGRCVDVFMQNGATLQCVLADVKRTEDTKNGANRYGAINNDVLEFIVDGKKLSEAVRISGNVSNAGEQFKGEAVYMIVYDMWIEGFGKK